MPRGGAVSSSRTRIGPAGGVENPFIHEVNTNETQDPDPDGRGDRLRGDRLLEKGHVLGADPALDDRVVVVAGHEAGDLCVVTVEIAEARGEPGRSII